MPDALVVHEAAPLAEVREQPVAATQTILDLIRFGMEKGVPVESLEKLQAMHERATDRQAATEFAAAVAEFQRICPPIKKNKVVDFQPKNGGRVKFNYSDLPEIVKTVAKPLQSVGLSYTWNSDFSGNRMVITCILRHINGHQESAQFVCPVESNAGMSEQQKYAAALSFGKRQSLLARLGIVTTEAGEAEQDSTPISEDEAADIEAMCDEHKLNKAKLLKWIGVESFALIPARRKAEVLKGIEETVKARAAKAGAA